MIIGIKIISCFIQIPIVFDGTKEIKLSLDITTLLLLGCRLCCWLLFHDLLLFLIALGFSRWQWFGAFNWFAIECTVLGCNTSQLLEDGLDHAILGAFGEAKLEAIEVGQVCTLKNHRKSFGLASTVPQHTSHLAQNSQFSLPWRAQPTKSLSISP